MIVSKPGFNIVEAYYDIVASNFHFVTHPSEPCEAEFGTKVWYLLFHFLWTLGAWLSKQGIKARMVVMHHTLLIMICCLKLLWCFMTTFWDYFLVGWKSTLATSRSVWGKCVHGYIEVHSPSSSALFLHETFGKEKLDDSNPKQSSTFVSKALM